MPFEVIPDARYPQEYLGEEFEITWKIRAFSESVENRRVSIPTFTPAQLSNSRFSFDIFNPTIIDAVLPHYRSTAHLIVHFKKVSLVTNTSLRIRLRLKIDFFPVNPTECDSGLFDFLYESHILPLHALPEVIPIGMFAYGNILLNNARIERNSMTIKCTVTLYDLRFHTTEQNDEIATQLQSFENFTSYYRRMLTKSLFSDITIRVADRAFDVHRCVLAAQSSRFRNELSNLDTRDRHIQDFNAEVVECFVQYLYRGDFQALSPENLEMLCRMAREYFVNGLAEECERRMNGA